MVTADRPLLFCEKIKLTKSRSPPINDQFTIRMDLQSVICPLSGVEYRCIHGERPDDVQYLGEWVRSLQGRFQNKEIVSLVVDCEGYFLGEIPDSGLTIQIGEVFAGGYRIGEDRNPPPVAPKPGVIVFFPLKDQVKSLLQVVFDSPFVQLITFDFTHDIAVILEAGIRVRYESIIDCQLATAADCSDQLRNTKISGMARFINEAPPSIDPLMRKAKNLGKQTVNWNAVFYVMEREHRDPFSLVDRRMLEYAASEITLTALACASAIRQGQMRVCIQRTRQKAEQFQRCLGQVNNPLYPSLQRICAFFQRYRVPTYGQFPPVLRTQQDIEAALRSWRDSHTFVMADTKLHITLNNPGRDQAILGKAETALAPQMAQIKALAGF